MKIQYCSDLHLEFPENHRALVSRPLEVAGDILVLAGDIVPLSSLRKHDWFFDWASDNFEMTYWIPGNHEYYGYNMAEQDICIHEKIRSNLILLNNRSVELDNAVIHFSTLWSHIGSSWAKTIKQRISDFHSITFKGERLDIDDFNYLHTEAKKFLNQAFENYHAQPTIVVTHHIPSLENYPREFYGSAISEVFAVELGESIRKWQPNFWIYGHHHRNVPTFSIEKTEIVTNQLGYVHFGEDVGFEHNKIIAI